MIFAWFFIDPQLPFYVFDELEWSTAQFGSAISLYGWAALVGSLVLSQSSDRFAETGTRGGPNPARLPICRLDGLE